ncbi:hypothetical protein KSP40_PGU014523 [Platanthera guangdongensis]|uniref:G domain-containing protein n=1 Tax=Platanthera guangdongensis TaxID=2320717 RepID=A0ABR2MZX4_9ASPA
MPPQHIAPSMACVHVALNTRHGGEKATIKRRQDLERQQSQRNVLQCFVFGPKNVGKSSLLSLLIGRHNSKNYISITSERCVVNVLELLEGTKKTLVMREIPEDSVKKLLSNKESLAAYDIVVFSATSTFSSDVNSFNKATEMLIQVATKGENSSFESDFQESSVRRHMAVSSSFTNSVGHSAHRVVAIGDVCSRKSSLILAADMKEFSRTKPGALLHVFLKEDLYPDPVPLYLIDTSSKYHQT